MINMTLVYTLPRATPWTTVIERLIGELSGAYSFGTPRVTGDDGESVTIIVDAVKRGDQA